MLNNLSLSRIVRFAFVGVTAAIVHYVVVVMIVSSFHLNPLLANIFGFVTAFFVSYIGQSKVTFGDKDFSHKVAIYKYFFTASMSFIINETLLFFGILFGLYYYIALIIAILGASFFTFFLSSKWVFRYGK